jgi:hypothetical protein
MAAAVAGFTPNVVDETLAKQQADHDAKAAAPRFHFTSHHCVTPPLP